MGLLVEARQMSAIGPDGLIFTSISAVIKEKQIAVVSGPPDPERTALLLALCGRLALAGGSLHTDPAYTDRSVAAVLRDRIAVAQAPPYVTLDPHLRVREAITERRLLCGKRMTVEAVHDACALMRLETPPPTAPIRDLDPVERLLLSVALAGSQHADGIAVADVDAGFGAADRLFVQQALRRISAAGKAVIATSADGGWGDVAIPLTGTPPGDGPEEAGEGEQGGDVDETTARPLPTYTNALGSRERRKRRFPRRRADDKGTGTHRASDDEAVDAEAGDSAS
ncbi:hypothetical protein ACFZAV_27595 [Streptomyces sp. NPDC008343]|uniref:hypothetical protein n=1 Tax=Streptomyces sp. NPDC008343 TaxID=3364828 RepID=UPI0036EC3E69